MTTKIMPKMETLFSIKIEHSAQKFMETSLHEVSIEVSN